MVVWEEGVIEKHEGQDVGSYSWMLEERENEPNYGLRKFGGITTFVVGWLVGQRRGEERREK